MAACNNTYTMVRMNPAVIQCQFDFSMDGMIDFNSFRCCLKK